MKRPEPRWHAVPFDIAISPRVRLMLGALTDTGLYGQSIEQTAERIITEEVRRILLDDNSMLNRPRRGLP